MMKVCSKCKKEKPEDEFFREKRQKSGRYPSCKDCFYIVAKNRDKEKLRLKNLRASKRYQQRYGRKKLRYRVMLVSLLLEVQGNFCGICKQVLTDPVEIDHIIPISRSGTDSFKNIQLCHKVCNRKKGNNY